jgi:hypothetical protein
MNMCHTRYVSFRAKEYRFLSADHSQTKAMDIVSAPSASFQTHSDVYPSLHKSMACPRYHSRHLARIALPSLATCGKSPHQAIFPVS